MRIFLAIDVPLRSIPRLSDSGLSYVSHYHITLAFFGDISPADLLLIREKLSIFRADSFTLKTKDQFDCFIRWDKLQTVFVPFEYSKQLNQLYLKLAYLFRGSFEFGKEFAPHATIARVKRELDEGSVLALQQTRFEPTSFSVSKLVLYESVLKPTGAEYRVVGTYALS
ncbi:MAG TPA: RNA 2',3'-cyclic phosphodiesterase [Acidobacteriota bacterium]|nr:RNA 2',3'-cyclic phosphodiesterase [Acidobacteriota bacterium]